jgi:TolB-like protein
LVQTWQLLGVIRLDETQQADLPLWSESDQIWGERYEGDLTDIFAVQARKT